MLVKNLLINLLIFNLLMTSCLAQNVYEISISSFANARDLKSINFQLFQGETLMAEQLSANGFFQFVIKEGDENYRLKANKESYIPKLILFNTNEYPFLNEYELQEIDIEFHKSNGDTNLVEVGELTWSSIGHQFNVVRIDSSREVTKQNYTASEKTLAEIYYHSIAKGDELMSIKKAEYALGHYVTALMAKANDDYAKKKIMEIKEMRLNELEATAEIDKTTMDKINSGEMIELPKEMKDNSILFSVQLGAFSKEIKDSDYAHVPEFRKIKYDDYTRIFSGEFSEVAAAIARKQEMISKGFRDAWIVQMKGHERIGF